MLNVRGKAGSFHYLSLPAKRLGSGWRVWQQRPSRLAQLQIKMVGNTANLVGEGGETEPVTVTGGFMTDLSMLRVVLICLEGQSLLSQQLFRLGGCSCGN